MKCRKSVILQSILISGVISAVLAVSPIFASAVPGEGMPTALRYIAADHQFVAGFNIRRLMANPHYEKLSQQMGPLQNEMMQFKQWTGLDPTRDIAYLVIAGHAGETSKPRSVMIVSGDFEKKRLISLMLSMPGALETIHAGVSVIRMPSRGNTNVINSIAFLSGHELALGDLESVEAALDTQRGTRESILSHAAMVPVLREISQDRIFWFAADVSTAALRPQVPLTAGIETSAIRWIAGALDLDENVTGRVTAKMTDTASAVKMAEAFRGLMALGQFSRKQNPALMLLLSTMAVTQDDMQVTFSFSFPLTAIIPLGRLQGDLGLP